MKSLRILALCCCAVALVGDVRGDAKDEAQKALLGKWSMKQKMGDLEIDGLLEFTKDGKLAMKMKVKEMELNFSGSYKVLSDTELEVTISVGGMTKMEKSKFKVEKDTLELTGKEGKTEKLTRVK